MSPNQLNGIVVHVGMQSRLKSVCKVDLRADFTYRYVKYIPISSTSHADMQKSTLTHASYVFQYHRLKSCISIPLSQYHCLKSCISIPLSQYHCLNTIVWMRDGESEQVEELKALVWNASSNNVSVSGRVFKKVYCSREGVIVMWLSTVRHSRCWDIVRHSRCWDIVNPL